MRKWEGEEVRKGGGVRKGGWGGGGIKGGSLKSYLQNFTNDMIVTKNPSFYPKSISQQFLLRL